MKVSIHIITYNHASFISQALDSALAQQTNFPYEIVVGEDCSTDHTRSILIEYMRAHPNQINGLLHHRNLGRRGENNFLTTLQSCCGEYVAFLEGDDYWIDSTKLQFQVDFLDKNPHLSGCFHDALIVDKFGQNLGPQWQRNYNCPNSGLANTFNQADCLSLYSTYPNCTLVVRRKYLEHLPLWFLESPNDFAMDLLITGSGDLAYLPRTVGVYRIHSGGIWQGQSKLCQALETLLRLKVLYDEPEFHQKYEQQLRQMIELRTDEINYLLTSGSIFTSQLLASAWRIANKTYRTRHIALTILRKILLPDLFQSYKFKIHPKTPLLT